MFAKIYENLDRRIARHGPGDVLGEFFWTIFILAFVLLVLGLAGFGVYESPWWGRGLELLGVLIIGIPCTVVGVIHSRHEVYAQAKAAENAAAREAAKPKER